ncbi:MAG: hypothetical protein WA416_12200 [Candidatus Sulfotelmatobacter sp.]
MATKKKAKKKSAKPKKSARGKVARAKKRVQARKTPKKLARKNSVRSKGVGKNKGMKRAASGKIASAGNAEVPKKRPGRSASAFSRGAPEPRLGDEAGDLQGLSNVESADSESVDELIEEGNAFEAGVVSGVEEADGEDEREVHTREVPEDDVPGEYLDND